MHECSPVVESNKKKTEDEAIVCSEELAVCAIRVLLVISVVGAAILQRVVVCRRFDPMIELDIREANYAIANQLRYDRIAGDSTEDDRGERFDSQKCHEAHKP